MITHEWFRLLLNGRLAESHIEDPPTSGITTGRCQNHHIASSGSSGVVKTCKYVYMDVVCTFLTHQRSVSCSNDTYPTNNTTCGSSHGHKPVFFKLAQPTPKKKLVRGKKQKFVGIRQTFRTKFSGLFVRADLCDFINSGCGNPPAQGHFTFETLDIRWVRCQNTQFCS